MRLNLGCGYNKRQGWTNVDRSAACNPDQLVDLESFPWPWEASTIDEIMLNHVLEHLGATTEGYIGIIKEIWRVCRNAATVVLSRWLVQQGVDRSILTKDLGDVTKELGYKPVNRYLPPRSAPQVAMADARPNTLSLTERVAGWVNKLVER